MTRLDFRGHGDSSYNTPSVNSIDYANDVALLCQYLDVHQAIFIGWSAGGILI